MKCDFRISLLIMVCGLGFHSLFAQEETEAPGGESSVVIPSLFEYPVAPEELPDLKAKTDYLMLNFWNPFDFKSKTSVDQNALNHAFSVYAQSMAYASPEKAEEGVKQIISKIKGNPVLSYQFARAAEENLYGPRADIWIDRVYMMFLENLLSNKKIDKNKKLRYAEQLRLLEASQPGSPLPAIKIIERSGAKRDYRPSKEFTLIEFGNPDCEDCRLSKLQMDISGTLNELIEDGRLEVAFIIPDDDEGELLEMASDYPAKWLVAASSDAPDKLDLRATPAVYLLDKNGKILAKNIGIDTAVSILDQIK